MKLHAIEKKYPRRTLENLSVSHRSIKMIFALPRKRHLHLDISIFPCEQERLLETYVTLHITLPYKHGGSESDHFLNAGEEKDIPGLLQEYLLVCIGDLNEHTYDGGMLSHLLQQLVGNREMVK